MFGKLQGTQYEQQALKFLLEIFEQEKDWKKAIETSRRMDTVAGQSNAVDIANFYCELAVGEMTHSRWEAARDYLREAVNVNRKCARVNILLGDIELTQRTTSRRSRPETYRGAESGVSFAGCRQAAACLSRPRAGG
jgi:lipopolysaccharide biosynthesis regulator YciM